MSELKCPFCNGELERVYSRPFQLICGKCGSLGTDELWQELIRTRKALDVAVQGIKKLGEYDPYKDPQSIYTIAQDIIEQITVLEQKDK